VHGIVSLQTLAPPTAKLAGRARKGHRRWTDNRVHLAPHLRIRRVPIPAATFSRLALRRTNSSGHRKHLCCWVTYHGGTVSAWRWPGPWRRSAPRGSEFPGGARPTRSARAHQQEVE